MSRDLVGPSCEASVAALRVAAAHAARARLRRADGVRALVRRASDRRGRHAEAAAEAARPPEAPRRLLAPLFRGTARVATRDAPLGAAYPETVRAHAERVLVSAAAVAAVTGVIFGLKQVAPVLGL